MDSLVSHRTTCRLCESHRVPLVLKLTPCAPVDAFVTASRLKEIQPVFPIDLYLCEDCGHAQLLDVVSPKLLFGDYIYTTASSPGLVEYFRNYAEEVCQKVKPTPGARVLDIGSNDGTLLSFLKQRGFQVLGVDPAREVAQAATSRGIETIPEFFNREVAKRIREEKGDFALITANNVFAHSDALGDMADGIRSLLAPEGVFVFEVSYLLDMIENMVFDFIYHEHLSHHSVKPLRSFLKKHGLHLFDVDRTPSKGGTLRCYAQLEGGPRPQAASVDKMIQAEESYGLYRKATYDAYAAKIDRAKEALQKIIRQARAEGKSIAGYGASATGTVLTYHFDLGESLEFIVDDNPVRQDRYSPGHHIPVLSSAALESHKPDYVLILAWRFADMIIQKNKKFTEAGGRFIIPLPGLRVV